MSAPHSRRRRKLQRFATSIALAPRAGWRLRGSQWSLSKSVSILLLTLALAALYLACNDYTFFVYGATIQGNQLLDAEEIYATAAVHNHSVFWLSPRLVAERIGLHPYISHVSVSCSLPNRVTITVAERFPSLTWRKGTDELWVDESGAALPPLWDSGPAVVLEDEEALAASAAQGMNPDIVDAILRIHEMLPGVVKFRYERTWGLLFRTEEGWQVALGGPERLRQKVLTLSSVQRDLVSRGEEPELVDLRFGVPYYR